ncbi:glycosyltransferase [Flavobacterium sp.]|uniref:glycosyltransferase n=1 Tax=Flavobacterium sp. TaxID=239 RepID=UPI002C40D854|nr:glycosyltransferase [Flavobacterium sp.]HSD06036.1 glycosyltransferase [Flavobacterium sp.]
MKQLHIIPTMNPKSGGPCQGIRNVAPYLQNFGIENEVVCLDSPSEEYGIEDSFMIYKLGNGKTSYQYHATLVNWLVENLDNYEAVIVNGLWQYSNYAVYKAIQQLKKENKKVPKVVVMPHGMLDPYFQKAPERKWKALRNELVWQFIEKKCINNADALFFTCEEELLLARTTFKGYHPIKESNVGFGIQKPPVNISRMNEAFQQLLPNLKKNYWLFLSRIHHKKGIDLLIDAYNQLTSETDAIPDLVIAGSTDSDYAQQMMKKAKNNPKIHFSGMLSGDSKWGAFYGCDAYLLPSHQENFGIAIVEAMACEKPVLITKNINIWREIKAGEGGWILEDLNVDTIKNQLEIISKMNKEQLQDFGKKAYQVFVDKFDVQDRASYFAKTIKELCV